ncbi:hypothetical protein FC83_GL002785 [Agrilactobacillus composti DSM 18527 = JCM 14202]|jgi:putative iron-only hydrogenase system regulator|uniref:Iron-only hydrogenase system regulator n=1 Tax=Agrilactobacillus composti DSM 18527 = JCM 14202 TaxID=1423734 RepID=X0PUM9_9LACO|nr:TM1266 family iron-only hydrogenase system putative regulator [Agrilactobacillus composti]KRM33534.1 hypothetical protein FC83_GL002785 [Agrilactobacillus composti DSM 18527 = JCM 14202]MCH4170076.1 iron-only hydrogenase system regulator [Lactobacillus sp.]GAF41827.1 hypothetical protein JCM14202_3788 [Agrilactobacillus composti DSM 18527 = JCM 14202]
MATTIAVIGIIVEDMSSTPKLNAILHEHRTKIVGRMGLPYRQRGVHVISIVIDAPTEEISALTDRVSELPGVHAKTAYSNVVTDG